jgi:hypothetical protein
LAVAALKPVPLGVGLVTVVGQAITVVLPTFLVLAMRAAVAAIPHPLGLLLQVAEVVEAVNQLGVQLLNSVQRLVELEILTLVTVVTPQTCAAVV